MKNLFSKTSKAKKNAKAISHNPLLERKVRRGYRRYRAVIVNNLSDFIFGLIRAVGIILLGWGIVQVGLSLQSHDPSQRSNGFLTLAGGIVITFAKEILNLITG